MDLGGFELGEKMRVDEALELYKDGKFDEIFKRSCPSVDDITRFIINAFTASGKIHSPSAVIGLSGGLDSAVVSTLAVKAFDDHYYWEGRKVEEWGKYFVHGLIMPSDTNSAEDTEYAIKHAERLGIEYEVVPIDELEKPFLKLENYFKDDIAKGNLKARIRMILLYDRARSMWPDGSLVLGTTNFSEYLTGYFTKYGDGAADIEPILPLYKTQVKMIARELRIDERIINRPPTAGLWEGQTDEDELGLTYELLDKILLGLELGLTWSNDVADIVFQNEEPNYELVGKVFRLVTASEHKRRSPISLEMKFDRSPLY